LLDDATSQVHWTANAMDEGRDFLFHANAAMLQALHHGKAALTSRPRGKRSKRYCSRRIS
jgi:hypothetical protein